MVLGYYQNHETSGNSLVTLLVQEYQYIAFFRAYLDTILKTLARQTDLFNRIINGWKDEQILDSFFWSLWNRLVKSKKNSMVQCEQFLNKLSNYKIIHTRQAWFIKSKLCSIFSKTINAGTTWRMGNPVKVSYNIQKTIINVRNLSKT